MEARLLLEDGTLYTGKGIGAQATAVGEVVFNTSMTGYQEILTDPSYCGQIIMMTYPMIGNYGLNLDDFESRRSFARGFIVREACEHPSNWRCGQTLTAYLRSQNVAGLAGIDTRELTKRIRMHGTMKGIISTEELSREELEQRLQATPLKIDVVDEATVTEPYHLAGSGKKVAVLDYGIKQNILRSLAVRGCDLTVFPAGSSAAEVLASNPDGIFLSNGPGDPMDVPKAIAVVRELMDYRPIFGICLGHQLLGMAAGGKHYKLKFGHRGANHPVKDLLTGRVYITSQNHGYAISADSLQGLAMEVTHLNLNDDTVEGMQHRELPIFSVQYHPEAAPGPEDSAYLFERFMLSMGA